MTHYAFRIQTRQTIDHTLYFDRDEIVSVLLDGGADLEELNAMDDSSLLVAFEDAYYDSDPDVRAFIEEEQRRDDGDVSNDEMSMSLIEAVVA